MMRIKSVLQVVILVMLTCLVAPLAHAAELDIEEYPLEGAVHMDRGEFSHGSILLTGEDIKMQHNATLHALSYGKIGEGTAWQNPTSGNAGEIVPTHDYMVGHTPCRNFSIQVKAHGLDLTTKFVGCKQKGGVWTIRP